MKKIYLIFLLCSFIGFSQNPGDIVVTEFLNDADAVSDVPGEWLEIYNTTNNDIDLDGWVLRDDGTNSYTFSGTLLVPANSYFVMGRGPQDTSVNGGVNLDFSYGDGSFTLGNGDDEIVLENPSAVEIDRVNYGSSNDFPDEGAGVSIILDPTLDIATVDNNNGDNWCFSSTPFGDGDLGTPGAENDTCVAVCETDLGADEATCNTTNPGDTDDTYDVTLSYSGAATGENFVITTTPAGFTIGGDDPTTVADGVITVSNISEGTDITISVSNTADGGLCDLSRSITSPSCLPTGEVELELQGIIDFGLGGSDGKAVHVVATGDIADLSAYGIGVANNGGGSDGEEYTFPAQAVSAGDHILVARNLEEIENYLTTEGFNLFAFTLQATSSISQNGDDAIELYKNASVVETFGDVNVDGSDQDWEYSDSWAYKSTAGAVWPNGWTYGGVDCSDDSATTFDSTCVYPFVASLSNDEFLQNAFKVYPNPVSGNLVTIEIDLQGEKNIELFDLSGRRVMKEQLNTNQINVSELTSGVYLLKISVSQYTITKKLIIK